MGNNPGHGVPVIPSGVIVVVPPCLSACQRGYRWLYESHPWVYFGILGGLLFALTIIIVPLAIDMWRSR